MEELWWNEYEDACEQIADGNVEYGKARLRSIGLDESEVEGIVDELMS